MKKKKKKKETYFYIYNIHTNICTKNKYSFVHFYSMESE